MSTLNLSLIAFSNIPNVKPGDNIAKLILRAAASHNHVFQNGDVIAIAQKIISKAEGRLRNLADVVPSAEAQRVARQTEKDPRQVELILQESRKISRLRKGVLIVQHRLGFTCANAGIDRSNVDQDASTESDEWVLLLPENPDKSAAQIREQLFAQTGVNIGVVITDSHGRPKRLGTTGVAIGTAGLPALLDKRGQPDLYGYTLRVTEIGWADEIASAASLLMGQGNEGRPVVVLRGLSWGNQSGQASDLVRPAEFDLYA